ncbi:MAG: radical SAM protein, partial [Planctomycetota bacterium]|nr:radical SAM protein [Planctomycetota bacterium]
MKPDFLNLDFDEAPFIAIWEVTRACDLVCKHCRAEAQPERHPDELTTSEGFELIRQIREFGKPLFVITGGDPLYRPDIYSLVQHAHELGLRVALTPAGTPKLDADAINHLKLNGLSRLAVSLDGSKRRVHDEFRGVDGSYEWTVRAIRYARTIDLDVQVNTSIGKHNVHDVMRMAELMKELDICLWSVFFIVPTGRAGRRGIISAPEHEEVFDQLFELSKTMPFDIKTTAGQHYRRVVLQRRIEENGSEGNDGVMRSWSDGKSGNDDVKMETGGWVAHVKSVTGEGGTRPEFLTDKATAQRDASAMIGRAA